MLGTGNQVTIVAGRGRSLSITAVVTLLLLLLLHLQLPLIESVVVEVVEVEEVEGNQSETCSKVMSTQRRVILTSNGLSSGAIRAEFSRILKLRQPDVVKARVLVSLGPQEETLGVSFILFHWTNISLLLSSTSLMRS